MVGTGKTDKSVIIHHQISARQKLSTKQRCSLAWRTYIKNIQKPAKLIQTSPTGQKLVFSKPYFITMSNYDM